MKLFKKFKKLVKNCLFILGAIVIGGHAISTMRLSTEARALVATEASANPEIKPANLRQVIQEQFDRNQEAVERYDRNRAEAIKHRANQIEARKQELERMENQGFEMKGLPVDDAITLARYNLRQQCLRHDIKLGNLANEEEIMRMAEIKIKKAEGIPLTEEEKSFYARINGTRNQYEDAKKLTEDTYPDYGADSIETADFSGGGRAKIGLQGNKTVYIFESQEDIITGAHRYIGNISKDPGRFIVRIKNQRDKLTSHKVLEERVIDLFNSRGLSVEANQSNFSETSLTFGKGGICNNKIQSTISPYKQKTILDYIVPEKREQQQIEDMKKLRRQQESDELNALESKSVFQRVKERFNSDDQK